MVSVPTCVAIIVLTQSRTSLARRGRRTRRPRALRHSRAAGRGRVLRGRVPAIAPRHRRVHPGAGRWSRGARTPRDWRPSRTGCTRGGPPWPRASLLAPVVRRWPVAEDRRGQSASRGPSRCSTAAGSRHWCRPGGSASRSRASGSSRSCVGLLAGTAGLARGPGGAPRLPRPAWLPRERPVRRDDLVHRSVHPGLLLGAHTRAHHPRRGRARAAEPCGRPPDRVGRHGIPRHRCGGPRDSGGRGEPGDRPRRLPEPSRG